MINGDSSTSRGRMSARGSRTSHAKSSSRDGMGLKDIRALHWNVDGRDLHLASRESEVHRLTAEEIYEILVERSSTKWPELPSPPEELKGSRYPLVPVLRLESDDSSVPSVRLVAHHAAGEFDLQSTDLERGHVVLGDTWYPIEPAVSEEIGDLMRAHEASIGPCSLKLLIQLRRVASGGGPVEDNISGEPLSPLTFAPDYQESPPVQAQLYPYQLAGWRWLRFLHAEGLGGILADEMGLGKSLQVIAAICSREQPTSPCLIVAPGSILENWRREFKRFAPDLAVIKHHGPSRTGRPASLREYDVVITSYDNVIRDSSLLKMVAWDIVVLDEAQYIKNPEAARTQASKRLPRNVGIAVTGTPVENRLLDLWSILDFAQPDLLGSREQFESSFENNAHGAEALEEIVSPFILRRRVSEVAQDLPPRVDVPHVVELSPDEAATYEAIRRDISEEYGPSATLVALTKLRQFCAHPSLLEKGVSAAPALFSKFNRLEEIVSEIFLRGEKVLIFTSFTKMADMIASHITAGGFFARIIDGRTEISDRQLIIDEFSEASQPGALVLNPRAAGAGLNIIAANHVIHYNPEWNPALEDQASARAHRRGQELPVTIHRLLIADTVEDVIEERLTRKRELAAGAVVGVEGKDEDYEDIISVLNRSPLSRIE